MAVAPQFIGGSFTLMSNAMGGGMSDSYNFISKTRVLFGAGKLDAIAANGLATNGALYAHDPAPLSHDDVLAVLRMSYR